MRDGSTRYPRWSWVALLLLAAGAARAGMPAMPEIPQALPEAVRDALIAERKPLAERKMALLDEADASNRRCAQVVEGSPEHQACLAARADFNARVEVLRADMARLADDIGAAMDAEVARLRKVDGELTAAIDRDVTAINRLGFARRAEDFEAWTKLAADAQKQYEAEWQAQLGDALAAVAQDKLLAGFSRMGDAQLAGLVSRLERAGDPARAPALQALKEVQAARIGQRAHMGKQAAAIAAGIDRGLQGARAAKDEENLRFWLDFLCDAAEAGDAMKGCNLLKGEMLATTAALYANAASRVAAAEVDRLAALTEDQLKALQKLDGLLVRHVQERNAVRAALKELE